MPKLTPQQRAYIRKHTAVHEPDPSEEMGELNIVPFLDIVVNIIIFLLATTQAVLAVAQLDAQLPQLGRRVGRRSLDDGSTSLNLNVTVTAAGVIVAGSGGKLAPGCSDTQTGRVITVPVDGDGEQDWEGLTECVERIKSVPDFADENQVILSADPEIEFEQIVGAMDALRGPGPDELFPNVMLSAGVR